RALAFFLRREGPPAKQDRPVHFFHPEQGPGRPNRPGKCRCRRQPGRQLSGVITSPLRPRPETESRAARAKTQSAPPVALSLNVSVAFGSENTDCPVPLAFRNLVPLRPPDVPVRWSIFWASVSSLRLHSLIKDSRAETLLSNEVRPPIMR